MPDIRYVCLSDLHLGEEDSLLTNVTRTGGDVDTTSPSPVLVRLVDCLSELLKHSSPGARKPTLVLNGDVLELALSDMDKAAIVFSQFISLVMPKNGELFGEIIFLPGNHDHHLWEMARETQYLNYMRGLERITELKPPWHTTKVFMDMEGRDRLVSRFLTDVAQRFEHLRKREGEVLTAYPNFGDVSDDGRRCVIFHHGHFIEPLYRLMSTATSLVFPDRKRPDDVYAVEEENFAWIDFFWSAMGRSGEVGRDMESIYEATNDEHSLQSIADSLAKEVAKEYDLPLLWPDWVEEQVLKRLLRRYVVRRVAGRQERQRSGHDANETPLSETAGQGLRWYMEGPLHRQVEIEHGQMPGSVTLVFGHTHKPFQQVVDYKGYLQSVKVLNTGGWVVDTVEREPQHGGAVVLIDEQFNAVNVRLFDEARYEAWLEEPLPPGQQHTALWNRFNEVVKRDAEPWKSLGETAQGEIGRRADNLKDRINRRRLPEEPS